VSPVGRACVRLAFAGIACLLVDPGLAEAQRFSARDGEVAFVSTAPLQEFRGVSPHLTGQVDFVSRGVSFFIDLETLDSGNRRRDRDMRRNYLETERYPFATFNGTFVGMLDPRTITADSVQVEGMFTLRDIERPITVRGLVTREGEGLRVRASWPILLGDYGIERPRILFYEVSETLTLEINILLRPESP
jgi:polyisoprenoid-binding protein YceI